MKNLTLLILNISVLSATNASASTLSNMISDIDNAFSWTCSGSPCIGVAQEQTRALNTFSDYVDWKMTAPYSVTEQEGRKAKSVANTICNSNMRIGFDYLLPLINAENRALLRLSDLQQASGISNPRTCTMRIN